MTQYNKRRFMLVFDYFQSAWFCMLALGGLSDMLLIPRLAIGYWPTLLFMIIIREATPLGLYSPLVFLYDNKDKETEL